MADPDANLQLKKRARRRLVGAFAFAGLAAVVLPMVMDEEPKQQVQDVQIRIPSQDQPPFTPKLVKPATSAPAGAAAPEKMAEKAAEKSVENATDKAAEKAVEKPAEKQTEKTPEKAVQHTPEKTPEKPAAKASENAVKPAASEPQRAAAILGGKTGDPAPGAAADGGGPYLILIGAFSNAANVKQLQVKIGELGIKVFTEPLDSPEGKKTRVRAGPFASREAADKALDKMKRIGVSGVISARQ